MADQISVSVVVSLSVSVAFQPSSAAEAEEARQKMLDNERRMAEYGRITRGEKVNGWKSCEFQPDVAYWELIAPMWPKNGEDAPVDTSVLALKKHTASLKHSESCIVRRYSLIAPGLYDDIVIFSFKKKDWWPTVQCYIDESVVAIAWKRRWTKEIRIVLVEVNSKTYLFLEVAPPSQDADICTIFRYSINGDLLVLYRVQDDDDITTFHLGQYEISPSESVCSPIVRQSFKRQLDWPQGNWSFTSTFGSYLSFPGVFYHTSRANADSVISLDRHGIHDFGRQRDWIRKFERTTIGLRMAKTKDSLKNVLPSGGNGSFATFELHRSQLYARVRVSTNVHWFNRPLSPPSMPYLAAEAFCLANPNRNFADVDWKEEIGYDFPGGILEGKTAALISM